MNTRYEQLVGHAPDGIVVHDGERILEVNAAMIRLAGARDASQLVGRPVADVLSHSHLHAVERELVAAFSGLESDSSADAQVLCASGERCDVELSTQLFLDADRPAVHVVVRDLTAQRTQAKLAQIAADREHLLARMQIIRALAGGVAHEVNNMLQIIIGYATVLEHDSLTKPQVADVEEIQRAAAHAASITRQLSQFAGNAELRPQIVDLAEEIPRLYRDYRHAFGSQRRMLVEARNAVVVAVDMRHLRLVFNSLMSNAYRATILSGDVRVTVELKSVSDSTTAADGRLLPMGEYGVFTIADTGAGMSEATQQQLFVPFFTTQAVGQGIGLGLAAANGLLLQNEAYITFASALRKGSVFTVWIPVERSRETPLSSGQA